MRTIPKFTKTNICFVTKLDSENESKTKFNICSEWVEKNKDKTFGFTCMNYGKSEPKLKNTLFYIFRSRNRKDILENNKLLADYLKNYGFFEIAGSNREVDNILEIIQ